jgi:hypothetical protein
MDYRKAARFATTLENSQPHSRADLAAEELPDRMPLWGHAPGFNENRATPSPPA